MKHKKKNKPSYAIYNFPYFKREQGFSRIIPLKALLAFITCGAGAAYSSLLLKITDGAAGAVLTALLSFTVFYTLFTLFKKRYVWGFALAVSGFSWLIYRKELIEAAIRFSRYVLKISNGPLISTGGYGFSEADPFPILTVIYILFGLVCAASSVRRFYPEPIFLFEAVMAVPAFLSLNASYRFSLGLFMAGMIGQWATNTSAAANTFLSTGGVYNMHISDRLYKKGVSKLPRKKRLSLNAQRYGKHLSDGFIMFAVTLTALGIVSSVFPEDGAIRFDKIISSAAEFFQNAENWGTNFFNSFSTPSFEGFFSADGGSINISGGLSPDGHPRTGIKVAEVITESTDKIYLRGDVGYSFDGRSWRSISKIDYPTVNYSSIYTGQAYNIGEALDNYIPELQYFMAYNMISSSSKYPKDPFRLQTVKVNYIQNINTVLFPGTPFIYTFRDNSNFSVKGDFVALANKGRINSMETGVIFPTDICYDYLSTFYFDEDSYDEYFYYNPGEAPVEFDDFKSLTSIYKNFVYDYYTSISLADSKTISGFLDEISFEYPWNISFSENVDRMKAANAIEKYLLSGRYKYSLATDNFSGGSSPIDNFLNKTRSGHCAMYASAMCLALRYLGIPARYVTGFTVGGEDYVSHSGGEYKYEVTDSDLHAWVEMYIDGFGWLPFDPTPPSSGSPMIDPVYTTVTTPAPMTTPPVTNTTTSTSATTPSETTTASSSSSETTASTVSSDPDGSGENEDNSEIIKIILIIAACLLGVFVIFMSITGTLKGLNRKQRERLKFFKSGEADKAVKEMLDFMLKLLLLRGIKRQKGETPEKFGSRVDETLGFSEVVSNAIPVFEKSEFDKDPVFTEEEQETVYACITELLDSTLVNMRSPKRLITRFKLFGRKLKR